MEYGVAITALVSMECILCSLVKLAQGYLPRHSVDCAAIGTAELPFETLLLVFQLLSF